MAESEECETPPVGKLFYFQITLCIYYFTFSIYLLFSIHTLKEYFQVVNPNRFNLHVIKSSNNSCMNNYYVYIVASEKNGTTYIGVTNNLLRRVAEHKRKEFKGFTEKYGVDKLVWFLQSHDIKSTIVKEKQVKKWNRKWKIREIEKMNPEWKDLFYEIGGSDDMLKHNFPLM